MSVVVVIPSRGRPERAQEAVAAALANATSPDTRIVVAIDADDPTFAEYTERFFVRPEHFGSDVTIDVLKGPETGDLVRATNTVSLRIARREPTAIIGNLGDDHLIRTPGWDRLVAAALETPGIAYGNDLIHGEALPTAPFISAAYVLALGWYALPTCHHLFIDTAWKDIGELAGTLRYLPELVIEHIHPLVGKAEWDAGYLLANSDETTTHDRAAYETWRAGSALADVARLAAIQ